MWWVRLRLGTFLMLTFDCCCSCCHFVLLSLLSCCHCCHCCHCRFCCYRRSGTGFDFSHPSSKIGAVSANARTYSRTRGISIFVSAEDPVGDEESVQLAPTTFLKSVKSDNTAMKERFQERRRRASS